MDKVLDHTLVTVHGLKLTPTAVDGVVVGPTPTTTILVEGTPAEVLLDTRSPVTIVSLDFLVKALSFVERNTVTTKLFVTWSLLP